MKVFIASLFVCLFVTASPRLVSAAELIFVHAPGCHYCDQWRKEIAPGYANSAEGKRLPVREVNLKEGLKGDLKHLRRPAFTPTFIVIDDARREVGRIQGYNQEFFWTFLADLVAKLDQSVPGN